MLSNNLPDAKITLLTDYLAFADPIFSVPVAFALTRVKHYNPMFLRIPNFLSALIFSGSNTLLRADG